MQKNKSLRGTDWLEFKSLPLAEKALYLNEGVRPVHTLLAQQFNRAMLDRLCELATCVRKIARTRGGMNYLQSLLSEKRVMLYFAQPSTRTFLSFFNACQILGITPSEVRDTATSSEVKGETPEDSVRTFSSYVDMIVMRHPVGGFAERIAWMLSNSDRPVPLINAGSGKDQHPTQSLLDIYTLQRSFEGRGGMDGKQVVFVGDLARGRTVRSLARLLTEYEGVKAWFVAPKELQIHADVLEQLDAAGMDYEVCEDFERVIPQADAIYMTRIQDEWDVAHESSTLDVERFYFTAEHLRLLKPDAVLMHPLPRRKEIDPAVDDDPRAVYWRQVRNGMWIRVALMIQMFGRVAEVDRYYGDLMR